MSASACIAAVGSGEAQRRSKGSMTATPPPTPNGWNRIAAASPTAVIKSKGLHLGLFGNLQRFVDLDSEVSDGALQLAMAE